MDVETPEELFAMPVANSKHANEIRYKAGKSKNAIFRALEKSQSTRSTEVFFKYYALWHELKCLSFRAGYIKYVKPYFVRKAVANRLDGMHV